MLCLGDSFPFGSEVKEEGTFATLVETALGDAVSVVNGGHTDCIITPKYSPNDGCAS